MATILNMLKELKIWASQFVLHLNGLHTYPLNWHNSLKEFHNIKRAIPFSVSPYVKYKLLYSCLEYSFYYVPKCGFQRGLIYVSFTLSKTSLFIGASGFSHYQSGLGDLSELPLCYQLVLDLIYFCKLLHGF